MGLGKKQLDLGGNPLLHKVLATAGGVMASIKWRAHTNTHSAFHGHFSR